MSVYAAGSTAREDHEDGALHGRRHRINGEWGDEPVEFVLPPAWMRNAKCSDAAYATYDFVDHPGEQERAVCRLCPVRAACLQYALDTRQPHGMWGGFDTAQRKEMR